MATIIWGYPRGMRGNHVENLIGHLGTLTYLLAAAKAQPIADWKQHYANVRPINGINLYQVFELSIYSGSRTRRIDPGRSNHSGGKSRDFRGFEAVAKLELPQCRPFLPRVFAVFNLAACRTHGCNILIYLKM